MSADARRSHNLRGIVAMLLAMGCFSVMDTAIKTLSAHYSPLQVAALRGLSAWPLVLAHVMWQRQVGSLWRVRWPLLWASRCRACTMWRGICSRRF